VSGEIQSYRDLKVWQEAMALAEACYDLTRTFPREEMYGLTAQIRRAAVSIVANIAEGRGRETTSVIVQFVRTAQGSLKELEPHLILSQRVNLAPAAAIEPLLLRSDELGRMLRSLIRSRQRRRDRSA
jgi:four helix bundle protein